MIALLDDVVSIAKIAALTLDDAATQTAKAGTKAISKAAGIVIDDAAVTPRYVDCSLVTCLDPRVGSSFRWTRDDSSCL